MRHPCVPSGIAFALLQKTFDMKHFASCVTAAFILIFSLAACSNNSSKTNNSDSDLTKIDTTVNPADHTKAVQSDSAYPNGAVGLDTVAGGRSTSAGKKAKKKPK
jgi:hypothetical protein